MNAIYYSKEEIEKAREMDLLTYLRFYEPENLVRLHGDVYCTRQHDSLKISNGKWMWWSRGFGGSSALDYLTKVKGISFSDAMEILTGTKETAPSFFMPSPEKNECKRLLLPEKNRSTKHIKKYLMRRGITRNIIEKCIEDGILFESKLYHNCIFIGKDACKNPRYAAFRACTDERIMGEAAGSDKSYPFRIEAPNSPVLHLFESAIDLLSYASLVQRRSCRWNDENLLSMVGISVSKHGSIPLALRRFLDDNPQIREIEIHFDRDTAGRSAAASLSKALEGRYLVINSPPPQGKDYNDYLKKLIAENRYDWR